MTNEQRAERFYRAMLALKSYYDNDDMETDLVDLLTDARHESELHTPMDIDAVVRMPEAHFTAECEEAEG